MKMMDFDRIQNTIFRTGDLNVKLMLLPNRKQASSGNLLTGSYVNTYKSQQYNDRSELASLDINFNTYINFDYLQFVDNNRISESVLVSYPHLTSLQDFLVNTSNLLIEDYEAIYTQQGIAPEYNEWMTSEGLTQGKILGVVPAFVDVVVNEVATQEPGVLFLVKDDKYIVEMTLNAYIGLVDDVGAIANSAALRTAANQLYTMAQLDYLIFNNTGGGGLLGGGSGGGTSNAGGVFNKTNKRPSFGGGGGSTHTKNADRPAQGLSRRSSGSIPRRSSTGGLGKLGSPSTPATSDQEEETTVIPPKPTRITKPTVEKTTLDDLADEQVDLDGEDASLGGGSLDNSSNETGDDGLLNDILEQAKKEEFDLGDDDLDESDLDY